MGSIKPQSTTSQAPKSTVVVVSTSTDQQFASALRAIAAKYR